MGIFTFLADTSSNANTYGETSWGQAILGFLQDYLVPITITLLVMAAIFCVVLAFLMMKTEKPETQATYKKRMFQICIAILVSLALVWILYWLLGSPGFKGFIDGLKNTVKEGFKSSTTTNYQANLFENGNIIQNFLIKIL